MTGSVFKEKVMSDLNMTIGVLLNFYRYILGTPMFSKSSGQCLKRKFPWGYAVQKQFDMPYLLMWQFVIMSLLIVYNLFLLCMK